MGAHRDRVGQPVACGVVLGRFGDVLGLSWVRLGAVLTAFWAVLERLGGVSEASWNVLGASWAVMGAIFLAFYYFFEACHFGNVFYLLLIDFCSQLPPKILQKSSPRCSGSTIFAKSPFEVETDF